MVRCLAVAVVAAALLFAPAASATPVFDCTQPEIRRQYPAQCPELPDPLLTGGGGHGGGGPSGCGGLCGIVRGVLGAVGGLL
jgi:hypothetical protein